MSPCLTTELKKHKLACPVSEFNLVFCNAEGKGLDPDSLVGRQFLPALRRAKIRGIRFHDLRHTNVALRIEQGQNIKYIQNQLGHASIQTTLDRYGHIIKEVNTCLDSTTFLPVSDTCSRLVSAEGLKQKSVG